MVRTTGPKLGGPGSIPGGGARGPSIVRLASSGALRGAGRLFSPQTWFFKRLHRNGGDSENRSTSRAQHIPTGKFTGGNELDRQIIYWKDGESSAFTYLVRKCIDRTSTGPPWYVRIKAKGESSATMISTGPFGYVDIKAQCEYSTKLISAGSFRSVEGKASK